jgi:predicted N-acetyltransferase YhbS
VTESHHGQGIGSSLMDALCAEANWRGVGLCLNLRDTNPAMRLYEKVGFRRVLGAEGKNRVGGYSFGMARRD